MKSKDFSIEIMKCLAAILITNSHMGALYASYPMLATGGGIGNALFFFCSGFTLGLGRFDRFDNWYKRRISRIYPSIFAWAILSAIVFHSLKTFGEIIVCDGYWFVKCIMICYVFAYFIGKYLINSMKIVFLLLALIVSFYVIPKPADYLIYSSGFYFNWWLYLIIMLFGMYYSTLKKEIQKFKRWHYLVITLVSLVSFYLLWYLCLHNIISKSLLIITIIPLLCFIMFLYQGLSSFDITKFIDTWFGKIVLFIGGLCFEIYLVQSSLFTTKMNNIFPLNIVIMFLIIFAVAYLTRCVSRLFSQVFSKDDLDWKAIVKPI